MKFGKYYVSYFYDKATGNTKYCSNTQGFSMDKEDCGNIQDAVANPQAPSGGGSGSGSGSGSGNGSGSGSSEPDEIIPEATVGETMHVSGKIANDSYIAGQNVKYGNLSWKVISEDNTTVTLILKENYAEAAFDTGGSTIYKGSSSWEILNGDFLDDNELIKEATKGGGIVSQGTNTGSKYYVRLPEKDELSTSIPNNSNTPFWTQTIDGTSLYFGDDTGAEGSSYTLSNYQSYYSGVKCKGAVPSYTYATTISSVSSIAPTTTDINNKYAQHESYVSTHLNCASWTQSGTYCGGSTASKNFCAQDYCTDGTACYAEPTCTYLTYYTVTNANLGLRPVITVKKTS